MNNKYSINKNENVSSILFDSSNFERIISGLLQARFIELNIVVN